MILRSPRPKFQSHLVFYTFHNRIFVIVSFEVVWPRRPRRPQKEPSECFQRFHFWNQFVPLIKMHYRVRYSLDFDLKSRSGQGCIRHLISIKYALWTLVTLSNLSKRWTFYVFDSFGFGLKPFTICRWRRPVFVFPQLFDHDFILSQISLCTNNQEWYIWTMMGDFRYPLWKNEFLIEKGYS